MAVRTGGRLTGGFWRDWHGLEGFWAANDLWTIFFLRGRDPLRVDLLVLGDKLGYFLRASSEWGLYLGTLLKVWVLADGFYRMV